MSESKSIPEALREAAAVLAGVSDTPRLDAELLMAHALGVSRDRMILDALEADAPVAFPLLLDRRLAHEPVAYITGTRAFWTIELKVAPGVLIPRPDTETLIEAAVEHFGKAGPATVLDLGTGSGALLLAALAEWPQAHGVGVDQSAEALAIAGENARALQLHDRVAFLEGGWDAAEGFFDLILCNPPYIREGENLPRQVAAFEPAGALYAGADGLEDYRRIAPLLRGYLAPGGIACLEVGQGQAANVAVLLHAEGLRTDLRQDLAGITRCVVASSSHY
ncbi:peptide chain release factor N(5)-glutamine methyltransferase [Sphingomonas sp. ID0503]|uniref:peptide chain release factor N(5)-glutamine methyltransferase n=1 Tax=Sphingomonas sp. ID0503 TaxID=3399691 RepID=UPI003AFAF775